VLSFDMPGVGSEPLPEGLRFGTGDALERSDLDAWREAGAASGLARVDGLGWNAFVVATDSHGAPTAVRIAAKRPGVVLGLALGHASLSHSTEGDRAPMRGEVWAAFGQLAKQGSDAFVRYGLAQMTRGGVDEDLAAEMIARFPNMDAVAAMVDALGREPEPIGELLDGLNLPLLLAKHEGCLGRTDEGFEDIVAAFPQAATVICPQQCSTSPSFAEALREFCAAVGE
jgi:hypothetical protein